MYFCIICKSNHHGKIDGMINKQSKTFDKHLKILRSLIKTNHCLNCLKGNNGVCEHFNIAQTYLFKNNFNLNKRIDIYMFLSLLNKCYMDNSIHNVNEVNLFCLL